MRTELVADAPKNAAATTTIEPDAIWPSDSGSVLHLSRFPHPRTAYATRAQAQRDVIRGPKYFAPAQSSACAFIVYS